MKFGTFLRISFVLLCFLIVIVIASDDNDNNEDGNGNGSHKRRKGQRHRDRERDRDNNRVRGQSTRRETIIETSTLLPRGLSESDRFYEAIRGRRVQQAHQTTNNRSNLKNNSKKEKPNIILIITDDQDVVLGSMNYMPKTSKIFKSKGLNFRNFFVSTPKCCPSRSSILTGLYVHNHHVYTNNDNCSSVYWKEKFERKTFASYLWDSGYYTSYIGKYLNKYDGTEIPYGWDEWNALIMNSKFYNYSVNVNGRRVRHGNVYEKDYYTDVISRDALEFLDRMSSRRERNPQPFLLVISYPAPHGPEDSAPKYSKMFFNERPHHIPNFNYAPNLDKQWLLRVTEKMTPQLFNYTNLLMTKRLQSLQSVDDSVDLIFDKIHHYFEDSTYIFYTSDHGYHVGQYGLIKGKSMPFEFDIRVPFYLSAPRNSILFGYDVIEPVLNIDIMPTLLDLAGIEVPKHVDGRSIVPLIKRYSPTYSFSNDALDVNNKLDWTHTFLIESSGRREYTNQSSQKKASSLAENGRGKKRKNKEFGLISFDDDETFGVNMENLCSAICPPDQRKHCRKGKPRIRFRKCLNTLDQMDNLFTYRENDPSSFSSVSHHSSNKKCRCRIKRSSTTSPEISDSFDWDSEKEKIDEEIDFLKLKIETLRNKRKEMRRKWISSELRKHNKKNKTRLILVGTTNSPISISSLPISTSTSTLGWDTFDFESQSSEETSVTNTDNDGKNNFGLDEMTESVFSFTSIAKNDENNNNRESREEDLKIDDGEIQSSGEETTKLYEIEKYDDEIIPISTNTNQGSNKGDLKHQEEEENVSLDFTFSEEDGVEMKETKGDNNNEPVDNQEVIIGKKLKHQHHHHRKFSGNGNGHSKKRLKGGSSSTSLILDEFSSRRSSSKKNNANCDCYNDPRWLRHREREERKKKKILNKLRKKQRYLNKINDPTIRHQAETCGTEERMNCFWHDNQHWKTPPLWDSGSFCFCMNANNNTYSCLRSINETHNYLYCQFITGFKMYFDMFQDPYQLKNIIGSLPAVQEDWMLKTLLRLKECHGSDDCLLKGQKNTSRISITDTNDNEEEGEGTTEEIWTQVFGRWPRKKKVSTRK